MQLHSPSTFPSRPSPKEVIPYSPAALRHDLERLRGIWEDCQARRDRNAIYGYLNAVYDLVAWYRKLSSMTTRLTLPAHHPVLHVPGFPRSLAGPPDFRAARTARTGPSSLCCR
jgi:hypothetical protein